MQKNLNRRRISLINKKNILYIFSILIILILISFTYSKKINYSKFIYSFVQDFSSNYKYQYLKTELSGLSKIEYKFINNILKKYENNSIFLLPLEEISNKIRDNNWVKNIKLSTNFKDTLFIDIEEYKPIGIYNFNSNLFFFDVNGKIIDKVTLDNNHKNSDLIIFSGQSSNIEAKLILDILDKINFYQHFKITNLIYIKNRRWNLILENKIKLMLSEKSPKKSLINFINVEKNLSKTEMNNIKYFDLRNISKTVISYN